MSKLLAYFSGSNGKTALVGVHGTLGMLGLVGYEGYAVIVKGAAFDPASFATAVGVAVGATAAAMGTHNLLASKADAIPNPPENS